MNRLGRSRLPKRSCRVDQFVNDKGEDEWALFEVDTNRRLKRGFWSFEEAIAGAGERGYVPYVRQGRDQFELATPIDSLAQTLCPDCKQALTLPGEDACGPCLDVRRYG